MHSHLGWLEAGVIGLLQGVTELFPVSSLGHSVLIPAVIGGSWARELNVSAPESPYLAFIVGLHVATAIALIIYFWRDWLRIIGGLFTSIRHRQVRTPDERLAWMLILATIPVGITGLLLEHTFRTVLAKPSPAAIFLMLNGVVLFGAEWLRRRQEAMTATVAASPASAAVAGGHLSGDSVITVANHSDIQVDAELSRMPIKRAVLIGTAQIIALAPGFSRSGAAMAAGLNRGLSHVSAARFSFLLATPVILAAGVLKIPDLMGPLGNGIRGQVVFGSVLSGLAAYVSVRFLSRYFETRSLRPFAWYCVVAGAVALVLVNR
ncbi:MAG: undecaprenyl-diphosphatase [Pseudonocardiales bacterium]|nr:undecaprenyl-diphosphatase [Pseudonocardiales bacterium]